MKASLKPFVESHKSHLTPLENLYKWQIDAKKLIKIWNFKKKSKESSGYNKTVCQSTRLDLAVAVRSCLLIEISEGIEEFLKRSC